MPDFLRKIQLNVDMNGISEFERPLFKKGLTSLDDIRVGTILTGRVVNQTHFGAFVDVGIGRDGLIHTSKMPKTVLKGKDSLQLGDKVEVKIDSIDKDKKRIGLSLKDLL